MTHHHPIDIDTMLGRERQWHVAALTDQLVGVTVRFSGEDVGAKFVRLELDATEAHELGTMLLRMSERAAPIASR